MGTFTFRTQEQRDHIIERRLRAIETGEFMEKIGLHEALGIAPPIGQNFYLGESTQDIRNRAARSGIALPGKSSPTIDEMIRLKQLERQHGIVAMNMPTTSRFGIAGERGGFSSWEFPNIQEIDFSTFITAGALTLNPYTMGFFPGNGNAQLIGAPDDVGPAVGIASASRAAAGGKNPMFAILSAWVLARAAGAVYVAAAGTTINPQIHSSAATAIQVLTSLVAAPYAVNGGTTFWTQLTLVAPADRAIQKSSGTGAASGIVQAFFGDALLTTLVTTGALTVPPNTLAVVYELA